MNQTKEKRIIQRNLPLDTTYRIIASYYCSLEDGGTVCQNCGRIICNICTVEDGRGNRYDIGMDCAETLSGLKNVNELEYLHKARFAEARQARAKLQKHIKEAGITGKHLVISAACYLPGQGFYNEAGGGYWHVEYGGWKNWDLRQYPKLNWELYVWPMIKDLLFVS